MRLEISHSQSARSTPLIGYRVSSQQHEGTLILSKKLQASTQLDYHNILDDGRNKTQSSAPNLLPINFCHTPGQYNKLLITNGKRGIVSAGQQKGEGVPTVEFLNTKVHKLNCLKREKMKELCRLKEKSRHKSTAVQIQSCNCCCCDNFCSVCSKQMHFNFDTQPVVSAVPRTSFKKIRTQRGKGSPVRKVIELESEKREWVNKSQRQRVQKRKKRNASVQYSAEEPESYQRIRPLLERSLEKQRQLEQWQSLHNPQTLALEKVSRVRSYDQKRKMIASKSIKMKEFKPQHPWGYHEPRQGIPVDKSCHVHHYPDATLLKKYTEVKKSKKPKEQKEPPCHPSSSISPQLAEMNRKLFGQRAYQRLNRDKQKKIQQKTRITQNLRKLQSQRKQILSKNPKQTFKPSDAVIKKAFLELDTP